MEVDPEQVSASKGDLRVFGAVYEAKFRVLCSSNALMENSSSKYHQPVEILGSKFEFASVIQASLSCTVSCFQRCEKPFFLKGHFSLCLMNFQFLRHNSIMVCMAYCSMMSLRAMVLIVSRSRQDSGNEELHFGK